MVTGGAGFIGSHVADKLLAEGHEVACLDDFNDYYPKDIKRKNVQHNLKNPRYSIFEMDIRDDLTPIFKKNGFDAIVHLAARAGVRPSLENPRLYYDVNVNGTVNLLEYAKEYGIARFIFASSSSVYGANTKIPFSEADPIERQISPYALTKKIGEQVCRYYSDQHGLNIVCLRFFTVYGERGRPDMAPYRFYDLISKGKEITMFGDGTTKRDYTYIADVVNGVYAALISELRFEIINLGNSHPIMLKDFISAVEKVSGKKAKVIRKEMQKGDVDMTYADISKAAKLLSYKPGFSVEEGMKRFAEWYHSDR